ncbi:gamma-glutamyl-gamma-aminobutyrate hydrolase family protein [Pseudomonadota bacterium]
MKIGLLNAYICDPDPKSYQYTYAPMFRQFFSEHISTTWILTEYRITQDKWPKTIDECDGWIICGSPKSVYDEDDWIAKLITFAKNCHQHKKPLVGICFGHQLIAQALGGEVNKSDKGWGVGVRNFDMLGYKPWMPEAKKECRLLFSHQDQVETLPPSAELLASDPFCPHQIFTIDEHILSIQGHPEFTTTYMRDRLESRRTVIGENRYQAACATLTKPTDSALFGSWIHAFFASAISKHHSAI